MSIVTDGRVAMTESERAVGAIATAERELIQAVQRLCTETADPALARAEDDVSECAHRVRCLRVRIPDLVRMAEVTVSPMTFTVGSAPESMPARSDAVRRWVAGSMVVSEHVRANDDQSTRDRAHARWCAVYGASVAQMAAEAGLTHRRPLTDAEWGTVVTTARSLADKIAETWTTLDATGAGK